MVTSLQEAVELEAAFDHARGGRWTSLRGGDREWLWRREAACRASARPGDPFVDAGGLEECIPTVRGVPDHGDAWTRPWRVTGDTAEISCPDFTLARRIRTEAGAIVADYRLSAEPGYAFIWAAHGLFDLSAAARLEAPTGTPTRLFPEAAGYLHRPWPDGARWIEGAWPAPHGRWLDTFGPDDGTAIGAVLRLASSGAGEVRVADGQDELQFRLESDQHPISLALWRNLGGFPVGSGYRSIGIEPMLGAVFDLADAGPGDAAIVPRCGETTWRLTIRARRHPVAAPAVRGSR